MDLAIITDDWPYDENEEANNIRKIVGLDGMMKIQVRLRNGAIQWALEGRPDGSKPHGRKTVLEHGRALMRRAEGLPGRHALSADLVQELDEELFDYCRRCRALFLFGDYARALRDVGHALSIVDFIRQHADDDSVAFHYDQYRPSLRANRGQTEMLLRLRGGAPRQALDALNGTIAEIEDFYIQYEMDEEIDDCNERQLLIDLRRSMREKHNVPLSDEELLRNLKAEQQIAIRKENYEMAARLRDKISLIEHRIGSHR